MPIPTATATTGGSKLLTGTRFSAGGTPMPARRKLRVGVKVAVVVTIRYGDL